MRNLFHNNRGFTLLEMIICLLLITIMVGLSTTLFASRQPSEQLKSGARDIATAVRQARMLARVSGEIQIVSIDIDNKNFGIEGRGRRSIPAGVNIVVTDPVNGRVTRGIYRIEFYPSGLSGTADISLEGYSRRIDIHLDPVIGASVVK